MVKSLQYGSRPAASLEQRTRISSHSPADRYSRVQRSPVSQAAQTSAGNPQWRIQEARSMFALMREEYEGSKRLSVPRRYQELKRIIEMFTAEPVTQRLHFLSTDEAEMRHMRALQSSRIHIADSASASCTAGSISSTGSVSSNGSSNSNSSSCSRISQRNTFNGSCSSISTNSSIYSMPAKSNTASFFSANRSKARSVDCRRCNKSTGSYSSLTRAGVRKDSFGFSRSCSLDNSSKNSCSIDTSGEQSKHSIASLQGKQSRRQESLRFLSTITLEDTCSEDDEVFEPCHQTEQRSISSQQLSQACTKAYDFMLDTVRLKGKKPTLPTARTTSHAMEMTEKHNWPQVQFPAVLVKMASLESFSGLCRGAGRVVGTTPRVFSTHRFRANAHSSGVRLSSTASSPSFSRKQERFHRKASKTSQGISQPNAPHCLHRTDSRRNIASKDQVPVFPIPGTKQPRYSTSSEMNKCATKSSTISEQRECHVNVSSDRGNESIWDKPSALQKNDSSFSFDSLDIQRHCSVLTSDMDSHLKQTKDSAVKMAGSTGFSYFSEELFFAREKTQNCSAAGGIDSLVLTIAHDHITTLRQEYAHLKGMNVCRRYNRMKSMLKSCMNVLQ